MDKVIVQLLMVGSVGYLVKYIFGATGSKQMSQALKMVTILICITIAIPAVWEMIKGVAEKLEAIHQWTENVEDKYAALKWLFWFGAKEGG